MTGHRTFWEKAKLNLVSPKVSDDKLDQQIREIRAKLPVPVFWLFGKAQSGKTSLIRALTGSSRAEIGNGFRPCTRSSQSYSFPNDEACFLKFLDTRGLGEADYDPAEDMRTVEKQAHLMIVVIKALDHANQCVLAPLSAIRKTHPEWPVIVVQTALHEGYPPGEMQHVLPYPYAAPPYPPTVPLDLARSLASQREWFPGRNVAFVPLDFTLPEDGLEPEHYGLDPLWAAIENALPLGLRGMMLEQSREARQPLRDIFLRKARPHVISYAIASAAAAAVPLPLVDIPLVSAIQVKMYHAIASIYGQPMSAQLMAEIGGTLGIGLLSRLGVRELLKFIPGLGSTVAALYAGASTYALGRTLCVYFSYARDGDVPDPQALRELYRKEYEEGRRHLASYFQTVKPGAAPHPPETNGNAAAAPTASGTTEVPL